MRKIYEHIKYNLRLRLPEWIISVALLIWGYIVYTRDSLFLKENYVPMGELASQEVWGLAAMGIAAIRLIFLIINGWWRSSAHLRSIGSILSVTLWSALILCYLSLSYQIPNIATIGALLALDLTSLWYAAEDAKLADLSVKRG